MSRGKPIACQALFSVFSVPILASAICISSAHSAEPAKIHLEDAIAVYGPWIFPAITKLVRCGEFRALVVRAAGTDMLFLDRLKPGDNDSTYSAEDGKSFPEFNYYESDNELKDISCKQHDQSVEITGTGFDYHREGNFDFTISIDITSKTYKYQDRYVQRADQTK